jgi:5'-phosphate synthase pdxT subunit
VTSAPIIGVLALQGDYREHIAMLQDLNAPVLPVRTASEVQSVAALIVPGGESTTMSLLADRFDLWPALHAARERRMPMLGTCAGMIMLADRIEGGRPDQQTIGGLDVTVERNAFGRQVDSFETDVALPDLGITDFPGVFIRAPRVRDIGSDVVILSRLSDGTIVSVQQGSILATSFHPELTTDTRIHEYFLALVGESA